MVKWVLFLERATIHSVASTLRLLFAEVVVAAVFFVADAFSTAVISACFFRLCALMFSFSSAVFSARFFRLDSFSSAVFEAYLAASLFCLDAFSSAVFEAYLAASLFRFDALSSSCHRPWYWREIYPDYGASR